MNRRLAFNEELLCSVSGYQEKGSREIQISEEPAEAGDQRIFRMADPSEGTSVPGFSIPATLHAVLGKCEIWVDEEILIDESSFSIFLDTIFIGCSSPGRGNLGDPLGLERGWPLQSPGLWPVE